MTFVIGHDAIHANVAHLPAGQACGYTTGSADIAWTGADWAAHPGAVRICQDYAATDHTADVLDVESGAATNAAAPGWYTAAHASYTAGVRPGQRHPALYTSASNVTPLVNALVAAGIRSGPALWVANWNLSDAQATATVAAASGPYPVIGVQFASGATYDTNVFSSSWLSGVAAHPGPTAGPYRHVVPPGHTLGQVAAARHTNVPHLLQVSAGAYTQADAQRDAGGVIYYTSNP